jgi:ribosomal protein L24E
MVVYADETKTLYIYKGDGKVYVFNTGTTLFGMKVEEEDE